VPTSQNGYPAGDRSLIRSATIAGTDVKVAVRNGPAGDLLLYAAARWHREVEPLRAPDGVLDCWGYAVRLVRGSSTVTSNHASGTALDLRARAHPRGAAPAANFTPAQIATIHRIVADCRGALRWGGDYQSAPKDGMHLEVTATEAACARVLAQLTAIDHPASPTSPALAAATPVAPASPLPPEEDDVDLRITPDEHGMFHTATQAEVGDGTQTGYHAGYVTLGSYWGGTDFIVTALGADGPMWQWNDGRDATGRAVPIRVTSNRQWSAQLPDGTRGVTVEGSVLDPTAQTVPTAAVWHVR
jgi:hypothetical protein